MGRAGFAKVSLTPPLGIEMGGYGIYLQRRATSVHDDLFVRVLWLEDESGECVILLTLDLLGLGEEVNRAVLSRTAEALALPVERVLVSCTHTHTGPASVSLLGWGTIDPAYIATIPIRCVEAALAARGEARPVRIGTAHGTLRTLGVNRVSPAGPLDSGLHLVRVDDMEGKPLVVLFSHGCHPVAIDRRTSAGTVISADWPGQVIRRLAEEGYGEAIFRLGACGDVDPIVAWRNFTFAGMELSAELVTQALLTLLPFVQTTEQFKLRVVQDTIELPLKPLTEQDIDAIVVEAHLRYQLTGETDGFSPLPEPASQSKKAILVPAEPRPDALINAAWLRFYHEWAETMHAKLAGRPEHLTVSLNALLLNGEAWLHLPGELFTALSLQIQECSPFPHTVVTTIANHFIGYIPDHKDFQNGGYAALVVPRLLLMPPYHPDTGELLVKKAIRLLETGREAV